MVAAGLEIHIEGVVCVNFPWECFQKSTFCMGFAKTRMVRLGNDVPFSNENGAYHGTIPYFPSPPHCELEAPMYEVNVTH